MPERYICIHGHFYQPPRENPWTGRVERQPSAHPYHDWNERITDESYRPNAASPILGPGGRVSQRVNNYGHISFNFGPTLLSWLETEAPDVHESLVQADLESRRRFGGHGSALAQAYHHTILPLSNARDKRTELVWGIADFTHRFGRRPEGLWLAETAVDIDTLELMAELGLKFTLLSPYQARRVRPLNSDDTAWRDATGGKIDPSRAYTQKLPSGREIALFFYDGPISQAIAFERLLDRGEALAGRLLSGLLGDGRDEAKLVHIATDGETYGHHHRHGDMALAYALREIEADGRAKLTTYGQFLALHPPTAEVEIAERTAWSCAHGVGRWSADCGCAAGRAGWTQAWRGPLRDALDRLRDSLLPLFESDAAQLLIDPWAARDGYMAVRLDPERRMTAFLTDHARCPLSPGDIARIVTLLELQRYTLMMYTSCGWFFDEVSGIETQQILQYAGRAIQLARELFAVDLESAFLRDLALAKSNLPEHGDAAQVYERFVLAAMAATDGLRSARPFAPRRRASERSAPAAGPVAPNETGEVAA